MWLSSLHIDYMHETQVPGSKTRAGTWKGKAEVESVYNYYGLRIA